MATVDSDPTELVVVSDYLGRLNAAGRDLAPTRRDELVAEVREHIDEALRAEHAAGRSGEAVARNVLERLGPPEEIVRAESESQPYDVRGAAPTGYAAPGNLPARSTAYGPASLWGPVEIAAVLLLSIGSLVLPVIGPIIGLVLVWVSAQWTRTQKITGSAIGLVPVLWIFIPFVTTGL